MKISQVLIMSLLMVGFSAVMAMDKPDVHLRTWVDFVKDDAAEECQMNYDIFHIDDVKHRIMTHFFCKRSRDMLQAMREGSHTKHTILGSLDSNFKNIQKYDVDIEGRIEPKTTKSKFTGRLDIIAKKDADIHVLNMQAAKIAEEFKKDYGVTMKYTVISYEDEQQINK